MTKSIRKEFDVDTYHKLKEKISNLNPPMRQQVIRAFSIYFYIINIAEQNHRIRRRRQYLLEENTSQSFSIEKTVEKVKKYSLANDELQEVLNDLSLELIMTAHPTEATKRTVLEIQKRISAHLRQLDSHLLTDKEKTDIEASLFNEVVTLWHTDELRHRQPEVLDEVRNGLYYFDQTLFDTLPDIFQELEVQLQEQISDREWDVPNFIRFGSWIGGDRDGNPNVTPEITWKTLEMQRELILEKYIHSINELMRRFSQTTERTIIDHQFIENMKKAEKIYLNAQEKWHVQSEMYRRKFAIILKRLKETGKSALGYPDAETLITDLTEIKDSAETHLPKTRRLKAIRKLIRQVEMFGFHLATLDIRTHIEEHEAAVCELLNYVFITDDYSSLSEEEKQKVLIRVLTDTRPLLISNDGYSKGTQDMLAIFKLIKNAHVEFGKRSIEVYLVSMTEEPSDLLEVLLLAKEAGIYRLYPDGTVE